MIQDIAPHIYHNEYHPSAPAEDSYLRCYQEGKILLRQKEPEGEISFPRFQERKEKEEHAGELVYLFTIDKDRFRRNYRISAVPLVSKPPVLRLLRRSYGAQQNGKTDVLPFLRPLRIPGSVSRCDHRDHQWR